MTIHRLAVAAIFSAAAVIETISYGSMSPTNLLAVAFLGGIYLNVVELRKLARPTKLLL